MPVVDVKNLDGKKIGTLQLADDVFASKVNQNLLHEAVRHHLAGERAGTHKTKEKSEVSGSGRKLWRQKGTGRARVGSVRSPLWRHGGTVHGPVPRSYRYALPKKMILGALRSALSAKLAEAKLTVVDGWALSSHKTKPFRQALSKLDSKTKTILLVESGDNPNLARASRNLEGVTLVASTALRAYDLMRHEHLMLSREAALKLNHALSSLEARQGSEAAPAKEAEPVAVEKALPAKAAKAVSKTVAKKPAVKKERSKGGAKKD
jgi:large subunit ribosomal protein L4